MFVKILKVHMFFYKKDKWMNNILRLQTKQKARLKLHVKDKYIKEQKWVTILQTQTLFWLPFHSIRVCLTQDVLVPLWSFSSDFGISDQTGHFFLTCNLKQYLIMVVKILSIHLSLLCNVWKKQHTVHWNYVSTKLHC